MPIVDLTRTLRHRGPSSRTQPVPMVFPSVTHEQTAPSFEGDFSIASMGLILSDHAGTHVDAWSHLAPGSASIDEMDLESFIAQATVVDISSLAPGEAAGASIADDVPSGAEAVLCRTGAPEPMDHTPGYHTDFPGLSSAAVDALHERGIRLLGTDARSIDTASSERAGAAGLPAHRACLRHGIVVVENLYLPEHLSGTVFEFMAFPLKIEAATGSPVRAIASVP